MSFSDCPNHEYLVRYVAGTLPDAVAEAIGRHLTTCEVCNTAIQSLRNQTDLAGAALEKPLTEEQGPNEPEDTQAQAEMLPPISRGGVGGQGDETKTLELGRVGQYRLLSKLGEGGMGAVYRALHTSLKKVVAVKLLPAARMEDAAAVARFRREMEAVGRLDHPHVVRATDAGEADGQHFLAMEYVEGIDLSRTRARPTASTSWRWSTSKESTCRG
jgi:hypothetical protein